MSNDFHIGEIIREVMLHKKYTVSLLAKSIHTTRTNMHRILRKDSIDIELLVRISLVLEYDFFRCISELKCAQFRQCLEKGSENGCSNNLF